MGIQEAIEQLQQAPLADRIQVIELLLQSLKDEITDGSVTSSVNKPFRIQTFDLGTDVQIDRDEMYADRVF